MHYIFDVESTNPLQYQNHSKAWVCNSPLVGDTTYDDADESALKLRQRGLFLCSNEIELEHPYYNTPCGRKDWLDLSQEKSNNSHASLWEDETTGKVIVKVTTALPDKFESFLRREQERALTLSSNSLKIG